MFFKRKINMLGMDRTNKTEEDCVNLHDLSKNDPIAF